MRKFKSLSYIAVSVLVSLLLFQNCSPFAAADEFDDLGAQISIGDMRFERAQVRAGATSFGAGQKATAEFSYHVNHWRNGTYAVAFDPRVPAHFKSTFMWACGYWTNGTNLKCKPWEGEIEYVYVEYDPAGPRDVCTSDVGAGNVPSKKTINLGPGCWDLRTILHVIGHSLGFIHEHQRIDRDSFVTILTENILPEALSEFAAIDLLSGNYLNERYDFDSIMVFDNKHYSKNGLPTIAAKPGYERDFHIEGIGGLSLVDRKRIRSLYPVAIAEALDCQLDGKTIPNGTEVKAYSAFTVKSGGLCANEMRRCENGQFTSGSFQFLSCTFQDAPAPTADEATPIVAPVVAPVVSPTLNPSVNPTVSPTVTPATIAPQIDFGPDRFYPSIYAVQIVAQNKVLVPASITDPSGVVASMFWSQVSGPTTVTYDNRYLRTTSIRNLAFGEYVMKLELRNAAGAVIASKATKVTLEAPAP